MGEGTYRSCSAVCKQPAGHLGECMSLLRNFVERLEMSDVTTEISANDTMRFRFRGIELPTVFDSSWLSTDEARSNADMMYDIVMKDKMRVMGAVNVNFGGRRR